MKKTREGFTIIEVVLVLAVAGLIFIIAFAALPALQVSSRDTQRRDDIAELVTNIKNYQTNNRGALPSDGTSVNGDDIENNIPAVQTASDNSWKAFYRDYLGKTFRDPLGYMYNLVITACGASRADQDCPANEAKKPKNQVFSERNYTITIVTSATCRGDTAVGTSSGRKVAVLYKLEGAGTYCQGT